ncbi:MAG TPA: hypothetical protein VLB83_04840 [Candidatus Paceibacterota bacterium]|nr:hypothetical protein [Candidatus Paceibacterota bacterium]
MDTSLVAALLILDTAVFLAVVVMHLAKKHSALIALYAAQSIAVSGMLLLIAREEHSASTYAVAAAIFLAKGALVPWLLRRLLAKGNIPATSASYLSTPETLFGLLLVTLFVQTLLVPALADLVRSPGLAFLALSALFASLLLALTRKGALAQIVAILAIENSLVAFVMLLGLRTHALLEFGIVLDILVWAFVASAFVGMITRHFGSTDVTIMKQLSE